MEETIEEPQKVDEPSSAKETEPLLQRMTDNWHFTAMSCVFVAIQVISYYIAIVSSQVAGLDINIFQYHMIRYPFQVVVAFCVARYNRRDITILKEHLSYVVTAAILDMTGTAFIFMTTIYLPIGNMNAFFNAVFIIIASCYEIVKRQISHLGVVTYSVVVLGILLMTQPWEHREEVKVMNITPCEYLHGINNDSHALYTNNLSDVTIPNNTAKEATATMEWIIQNQHLFGYFFLIISAMEYTGNGILSKFLLKEYHVSTVIFWMSLVEGVFSVVISLVWQSMRGDNFLIFPAGSYCVLFTCIYILFSGTSNYFSYYVLHYFQVSAYAVSLVCGTLLLYITQRTLLKYFHPGNANLIEILGVVFIIFGIAGLPILAKLVKQKTID